MLSSWSLFWVSCMRFRVASWASQIHANRHSPLGTFYHPNPNGTFPFVSPTRGLRVGDHTDCRSRRTRGSSMFAQTSVVVDIMTLEFFLQFRSVFHFYLCGLILRRLPVQRNLVALQWHPLLLRPSFETQKNPVLWTQLGSLNRLSQCHLWVQAGHYISEISVLTTPHFLRCQMSISDAKWTVLCSFCAARMTSCSALFFGHLPGRQLFELLPSVVHCCFGIQIFLSLGAWERTCAQDCSDSTSGTLSPQCDHRDLLIESLPNAFS